MEAVREFNQDHADVLRHREKHLPKILRLNIELVCGPGNLGQLGHAVHKHGDILAKHAGNLRPGQYRVLNDIVQKTRDNGLFVELKVREDNRDAERVNNIGLAGLPLLVHMRIFCGHIGAVNQRGVIRGMIALNGGNQLLIQ